MNHGWFFVRRDAIYGVRYSVTIYRDPTKTTFFRDCYFQIVIRIENIIFAINGHKEFVEMSEKHTALEKKFNSSRGNLLLVVILTTLNVILHLSGTDWFFLFSASFPMVVVIFGEIFSEASGNNLFMIIGASLALISIAFFTACYLITSKYKSWIVVALVALSLDSLLLLWLLTAAEEFGFSTVIEIAIRVWVMYYLVSGTRAWLALKKMPPVLEQDAIGEYDAADELYDDYDEEDEELPSITEAGEANEIKTETPPIRPQSAGGKVLVSQRYNNLKIVVKNNPKTVELIINDMVYAEKKGLFTISFDLEACVQNIAVKAVMGIHTDAKVLLYIDGNLLAEKKI